MNRPPVRARGRRLPLGALTLALSLSAPLTRAAPPEEEREARAQAPSRPADMPLSLLPEPPSLELPAPRPAALEALDAVLGRLVSTEPTAREQAFDELLEARADWVGGLSRRLDRLAERSDKPAMRSLLERLRGRVKGRDDEDTSSDYLRMVLASPAPDSQTWRDLTHTLAIARMLRHVQTAESARELIRVYVRFGEFVRIAVQRELDALGDRQIAALYEARRHPAPKIASWAEKRLDLLGKAIPHEAVRTQDPAALADILVALGRSRDAEAGRILISFAATERSQVRQAARQGLAALGEVGSWSLRDAYQDTTGKSAPRDWTWKRTARELFTEFDRIRSAKELELFEEAQKAATEERWEDMRHGYDRVLAWSPLFEQRELMAPGYMKYAEHVRESDAEAAMAACRRVERIAKEVSLRNRAESLRHTLEARALEARGLIDRGLLDKALALDPDNEEAEEALGRAAIEPGGLSAQARYLMAAAAAALGLLGSAWIGWGAWRRRRDAPTPPPAAREDDEARPELEPTSESAAAPDDDSNQPDSKPPSPVSIQPSPESISPSKESPSGSPSSESTPPSSASDAAHPEPEPEPPRRG